MNTKIKMQFDPQVAKDIGVEEAIMYSNIEFWVEHNKANGKNEHDGHFWTYNSMSAFCELFPFWTHEQIRRILKNLEKRGYIKTGNYNEHKYDQTKWYTCICANQQMEVSESTNGFVETNKPIPNPKPDVINTENKQPPNPQGGTAGKLVEAFFGLKEWEYDKSKSAIFRRHLRPAKDLLELCGGDLDMAIHKLNQIAYWAKAKELDWSIDTVLKKWFELDRLSSQVEKTKKAYIGNDRAYKNKNGQWMVILHDGSHANYQGSLDNLRYV